MRIADWNFNWQREYTYAEPIALPKGTTLLMQVCYDNSADNPQNPHNPPQRVFIGRDTFNEMAQVFFQVTPTNPADGDLLYADFNRKEFNNSIKREQFLIEIGRGTTEAHFNLGCLYSKLGDAPQALRQYQESIRLKPDNVFAINNLASIYRILGRHGEAIEEYSRALKINPHDARVHFNLGAILLSQRQPETAATHFEDALRINPEFADAWANLGLAVLQQGKLQLAKTHLEHAIQINPDLESARQNLRLVQVQIARTR